MTRTLFDWGKCKKKVIEKEKKDFDNCIANKKRQLKDKREKRNANLNKTRQEIKYKMGDFVLVKDLKQFQVVTKKNKTCLLTYFFKVIRLFRHDNSSQNELFGFLKWNVGLW